MKTSYKNRVGRTESFKEAMKPVRKKPGSMYDPIIKRMGKLKPRMAFTVGVPFRVKVRDFNNRLNATLIRSPVKAPKGFRFVKVVNEKEHWLTVCCIEGMRKKAKK